eukprot:CAMPEP_0175059470 /NCGR_PEP_ID=MMETSP0052_2-20121109/12450_1 /TAXON_ID=51329 ORGANISM="Polytomella parva, Strain SAG 63-3" /NCGR_SAMPLE_ID=MMETSP0052_2 /ASSEMBLY_ACC=CAM_ASM_000194 /LENGTH=291 /DNA_ID=CAMNT_0016325023 /DNA_START=497 /DNA_END=1373 /DNA_ORIENTATION=+
MNSGTFKTVLPGEGIEQESLRQVNAKLPLSYPSTNVRSSGLLDIESKKRSEKVSKHIPKEEKRKHKEERRREKKLRREKEKHRGNDYSLEEKLKKQRNKRSRENDSENSDSNDSQRSDSNSENDQHNNDYYLQKVRERRGADTNSFREDEEEPSQRNSIYDSKASGGDRVMIINEEEGLAAVEVPNVMIIAAVVEALDGEVLTVEAVVLSVVITVVEAAAQIVMNVDKARSAKSFVVVTVGANLEALLFQRDAILMHLVAHGVGVMKTIPIVLVGSRELYNIKSPTHFYHT